MSSCLLCVPGPEDLPTCSFDLLWNEGLPAVSSIWMHENEVQEGHPTDFSLLAWSMPIFELSFILISKAHMCECIMHNCDCIVLSTKSVNKQTLYKHLPEYSKLLLLVHTMTSLQYPGILKNTLSSSSGFREIPIHRMKCKHRLSRACQGNRRRYYLFRKTTLASQKDAKQRRKARKTLVFLSTHKH